MARACTVGQRRRATGRLPREVSAVLALSVVLVLAGAIPALAGLASGSYSYFTCGSYSYRNRASVETASYGATAGTYVSSNPLVSRPTGWYGATARLYNSNDALKKSKGPVYTDSACISFLLWTAPYTVRGNYYSYGISQSWTGNGYHSHATYKSPLQTY